MLTNVPKKKCVAVSIMLIYQYDTNIVPGPDTKNYLCLTVQPAK